MNDKKTDTGSVDEDTAAKLEKIPATELVRTSDVKRLMEAAKPKPITLPEARDLALRAMQDADESRDSANEELPELDSGS